MEYNNLWAMPFFFGSEDAICIHYMVHNDDVSKFSAIAIMQMIRCMSRVHVEQCSQLH